MLSNQEARVALLAAADHISANHKAYDFMTSRVPLSLDRKGCMVGWACYFAGQRDGYLIDSHSLFGRSPSSMYREMLRSTSFSMDSARRAATALRRYADKHYPHVDRYATTIPVWAQMRDREAQARLAAAPAYDKFRKDLDLSPLVPETESV